MKKTLSSLLLITSLLYSNEETKSPSELELFLFKVGFQSLLKDVDLTKEKVDVNESQILELNEKVDLILKQISKNSLLKKEEKSFDEKYYKNEVSSLKDEIKELKELLKSKNEKKVKKSKINKKNTLVRVKGKEVNIRNRPFSDALVIGTLQYGDFIEIESCNTYSWCKLKNKDEYVASFLLDFSY